MSEVPTILYIYLYIIIYYYTGFKSYRLYLYIIMQDLEHVVDYIYTLFD